MGMPTNNVCWWCEIALATVWFSVPAAILALESGGLSWVAFLFRFMCAWEGFSGLIFLEVSAGSSFIVVGNTSFSKVSPAVCSAEVIPGVVSPLSSPSVDFSSSPDFVSSVLVSSSPGCFSSTGFFPSVNSSVAVVSFGSSASSVWS